LSIPARYASIQRVPTGIRAPLLCPWQATFKIALMTLPPNPSAALKLYRTEWDTDKRIFRKKALHHWTSHAADSFAYLAMTADSGSPGFNRPLSYTNFAVA
jgi:hypothetical protein